MRRRQKNPFPNTILTFLFAACLSSVPWVSQGTEFHVAKSGNDSNKGTKSAPFLTIQRAAEAAQPGDVITVHAGTYRERINPPRGGTSDKNRITYRAAKGDKVEVKGSEVVTNWTKVQGKVWKVTLPNAFFKGYNPYGDLIRGDWFTPKNREHHTGAVYVNGHWLVEAVNLDEVMSENPPGWLGSQGQTYLLNVAWMRPVNAQSQKVPANSYTSDLGIIKAPCTEGGECIGYIEKDDWARYEGVDFGDGATHMEFRVASASAGGLIEIRFDKPNGELLGTCRVPHTSGWQSWVTQKPRIKPTSGKQNICLVFKPRPVQQNDPLKDARLWFAKVEGDTTTIWAQFDSANPNDGSVEINARQTVFYPDKPGRNYITVKGFTMRHAATQWAPPTAEQMGLIGTHWSKGWIIEDNIISHSVCSGVALGKYGDKFDNTSANTAEGYVKTIERALQNGWNRETVGHHVVRNNTISHCEQTGIVGSLGSAFCTVTGNTISDIHMRRLFSGAEMAGIKFHAAIDTVIQRNHIQRTCLGLWLDWMAQGTRVSSNIFHDNDTDLFLEVNHGPFMVDNNLFMSGNNLLDMSEGGAFVHNLFKGRLTSAPELSRETPYHPAHETKVAGLTNIAGADSRYYNNIFVGPGAGTPEAAAFGLSTYNPRKYPLYTGGNVFLNGATTYTNEANPVVSGKNPQPSVAIEGDEMKFRMGAAPELAKAKTVLVTSELLGKALISKVGYENADGTPLRIDRDFLGNKRSKSNPFPGPFELRKTSDPVEIELELDED